MRWWLVLLVGCGFSNKVGSGPDDANTEPMIDAPPDAPPDAFDPLCYGGGAFYFCLPAMPSGTRVLGNFNTTDCNLLGATTFMIGGVETCLVQADTITSSVDAGISGMRPLVLVARQITIGATIDAGSFRNNFRPGPGANDATCKSTGIDGTYNAGAAAGSGGAGGSFGSVGGNGGTGNGGAIAGGAAGPAITPPVAKLRGGCPGGNGQGASVVGGDGGGVIYIVARETLDITGSINASGAAGFGGSSGKAGGAGAGSGGMIVLHAGTLMLGANATLVANGGGGGGGGGMNTIGINGNEVITATPEVSATGGSNGGMGGTSNGGDGASRTTPATNGESTMNSGGGGGGGMGVIRILKGIADPSSIPATVASPTPTK